MNLYKVYHVFDDNYQNHQTTREIFPGNKKLLWKNRGNHLLVLTANNVDSRADGDDRVQFIDNIDNKIQSLNDNMEFSIKINSSKKVNGKRISIPDSELKQWVTNRLSGLGFELGSIQIFNEGRIVSIRKGISNTHSSVFVNGFLKIKDRDVFTETLKSGIGHAKGYGFGLLDVFHHE